MKFHLLKTVLIASGVAISMPLWAQNGKSSSQSPIQSQVVVNGSDGFSFNLRNQKITRQQLEQSLPKMLHLSSDNVFKATKTTTDNLGYTHIVYKQYFKGLPIEDGMVLMHIKDGYVTSVNGDILDIPEDFALLANTITPKQALSFARKAIGVSAVMNSYPEALVITQNRQANSNHKFVEAWRVRIDGKTPKGLYKMNRVFVDAQSGRLVNTYPLINESDVQGIGETVYRGNKTITIDSFADGYRLRDSARKIYTFNAGGVQPDTTTGSTDPFVRDVDYVNDSTFWGKIKTLNSFTVDSIGKPGFMNGLGMTTFLATGVGHGQINGVQNANFLNYSVLNPPYSLPLQATGLQVQVPDDSIYGALIKASIDINSFAITFIDSFFFHMPDTTLGTHSWTDTAGSGSGGSYTMGMSKNPALDAHWGMEQTIDYYKDVFNRSSYDNQGSKVRNYVNGAIFYAGTQDNAAALPAPYNSMVYGMGDGTTMGPVVGLDVMGHEFSHMVTANNGHGGLNYQNQSGALNESFSDMMGTAIEFFVDSATANWTIGEQVMLTAPGYMRSMSDPNGPSNVSQDFQRQPDTYLGQYWYTGQQDNGGVHINSGVSNKWFYLLSMGGSGTNDNGDQYNVTGQGISVAEKVAYRTFQQYLTPDATFNDAYTASLNAATDLYGENSNEYNAVKDAWYAVGIPNYDSTAITHVATHNDYIKIYPNPTSRNVTISSTWHQSFQMVIYSITGAKLRTITVEPGQKTINLSGLSRGTYILKYDLGHQSYSTKLTVI